MLAHFEIGQAAVVVDFIRTLAQALSARLKAATASLYFAALYSLTPWLKAFCASAAMITVAKPETPGENRKPNRSREKSHGHEMI
jgi:hypothetical protein